MSPKPKTEEWKEPPQTVGFWHTIPGLITAIAGLVTALAGLILALHQVGLLGNPKEPASVNQPIDSSAPVTSNTVGKTNLPNNSEHIISFPEGNTITLNSARAEYTILKAEAERLSPEKLNLKIYLRLTNKGNYDLNFWDRTFRLLIDEVPRAPISNLNLIANGRSAKEGEIIFEVPVAAKQLILQLSYNEEVVSIPIQIGMAK